ISLELSHPAPILHVWCGLRVRVRVSVRVICPYYARSKTVTIELFSSTHWPPMRCPWAAHGTTMGLPVGVPHGRHGKYCGMCRRPQNPGSEGSLIYPERFGPSRG
ncbi:unnamed protein product, partial [Ectocarpus sp. 12 AP-2014]